MKLPQDSLRCAVHIIWRCLTDMEVMSLRGVSHIWKHFWDLFWSLGASPSSNFPAARMSILNSCTNAVRLWYCRSTTVETNGSARDDSTQTRPRAALYLSVLSAISWRYATSQRLTLSSDQLACVANEFSR